MKSNNMNKVHMSLLLITEGNTAKCVKKIFYLNMYHYTNYFKSLVPKLKISCNVFFRIRLDLAASLSSLKMGAFSYSSSE